MITDPTLGDKRGRTRDQLLAAAQALLLEQSAASLGIRQITAKAGVVHATFYNYYPTVEALIEDIANLMQASHGLLVTRLREGIDDPAELFALTTRQTLRVIPVEPTYGRLLFDAGLPVDRFVSGLRATMQADVFDGIKRGVFHVEDRNIAVSMIAGGVLGIALDLHRRTLASKAIEAATAELLVSLGVTRKRAQKLATADATFISPPKLPLGWLALNLTPKGRAHVA